MQNNTKTQDLSSLIAYTRHKIQKADNPHQIDEKFNIRQWMEQPDENFIGMAELSVRMNLTGDLCAVCEDFFRKGISFDRTGHFQFTLNRDVTRNSAAQIKRPIRIDISLDHHT